jgi:hypothetical protein
MRYCKNLLSLSLRSMLVAWLFVAAAHAEGIAVNKVEARLGKDGYHLSAVYGIELNFEEQQALSRGIPLYFVAGFSLKRSRWDWLDATQQAVSRGIQRIFVSTPTTTHWSWLDKEIYSGEQTSKLSYNVLTGRYRISRGSLFQNFASLEEALNMLSRQSSATIPAALVEKGGKYIAAARLRMDITQLPKPLQVSVLTSGGWTLDSAWYRWRIDPAEVAAYSESAPE